MDIETEQTSTKAIVAFSITLPFCIVVFCYSLHIFLKVYKNFKTQDMTLFLTSLSLLLSAILTVGTMSMGLFARIFPNEK
jgi:hypothetical protein